MISRRAFLQRAAAAAAGTALATTVDWDRLLWVPGAKRILLPTPREYVYLSVGDWVTFEGDPGTYVITDEAYSHASIWQSRFVTIPARALTPMGPSSRGRVGIVTRIVEADRAHVPIAGPVSTLLERR